MKMDFGYHPRWLNVSSPEIAIETMADLEAIRSKINASKQVKGQWLYMPLKDGGPEPAGRYQLPTTHTLTLVNETDSDMSRFTIIVLGFLLGIRLLPAGWGHLHRTAIEQGAYSSFTPHDSEIIPCLKKAISFYKTTVNAIRKAHPSGNYPSSLESSSASPLP